MKMKHNSTRRVILLSTGCLTALAAGYGTGQMRGDRPFTARGAAPGQTAAGQPPEGGGETKSTAGKADTGTSAAFEHQRAWIERLRQAEVRDFETLWKEVMQTSDQYQRRAARELLYLKWVALDPAGCMEFIGRTDSGQREQALTAWLKHDADGACAWALALGDDRMVRESARVLFQKLAQMDPKKFLSLAASAKEEHVASESFQAAFRKLARTDPAGAVEALRGLSPKARSNGAWGLGIEWARTDPGAAFAWSQQLEDPVERESALRGVLISWARTDPDAAISRLDLLQKLPGAKGQDPKLTIIQSLAAKDPRRAMDFAITRLDNQNEKFGLLGMEVLPKLAASMTPVEFAAFLDKAGTVKTADGKASSYSDVLFVKKDEHTGLHYGSSFFPQDPDPAGTFRQLTGGTASEAQKRTASAVAQQWVEKDAAAVLTAYQSASDAATKEILSIALLGRATAEKDLNLLGMIEGEIKGNARSHLEESIRSQAHSDPAKVLAWADQLPADSKMRAPALDAAVNAWASYDTGKAIEYVQQLPAEDQPELFKSISNTWAASDAYGNSQWVASLPEGINRDHAASALIAHLAAKEPQSALEWARSVNDENVQSSSYESLFVNWGRRDQAAALRALQQENLPPEQAGKIEKLLKAGGIR